MTTPYEPAPAEVADDLGETFDQFCARQDAEEAARNEAAEVQRDRDADVRAYFNR